MIDCSKSANYFEEKARMTKSCSISCDDCPLSYMNNSTHESCVGFELRFTEKAIASVQEWSDEHPRKTYADDYFEKFPNSRRCKDGIPGLCRNYMHGIEEGCIGKSCVDCWNEAMPVETKENEK